LAKQFFRKQKNVAKFGVLLFNLENFDANYFNKKNTIKKPINHIHL